MKLYKFALSALLIGLSIGLSSCKNEEDDIFDGSAAQRLDEYKKLYSDVLTSNGGKWLMEYFANEEERGYVFVMDFNSDGSVKVSGQNVWMNGAYKSEVSLWQMVADNGPVLSFNTYNSVFHLFSTPENIEGDEAPTNPDNNNKDIDETGEGHAGDYEFVVIGVSEDGQTVHLTGKKRLYDIYLHRLDANVDNAEILSEYYIASQATFSNIFPDYLLTNSATGEQFVISGGPKGLFSIYPKDGDPVVQTVTMNALIGPNSIRFRLPLAIECANASDSIIVENFTLQDNGKFLCTDGGQNIVLDCIGLGNIFSMKEYSWHIDHTRCGGKFAEYMDAINSQSKSVMKVTFKGFDMEYSSTNKKYVLNYKRNGSKAEYYFFGDETVIDDGESVKISYSKTDVDTNAGLVIGRVPVVGEFLDYFNSCDFKIVTSNRFAPSKLILEDKSNPENYLYISLN
ncbi:MAG: DUF4302 domain-containing protein [Muribaculum sp.]|nr:DUF4302 domain-containing protein [Muribaculum sp.]